MRIKMSRGDYLKKKFKQYKYTNKIKMQFQKFLFLRKFIRLMIIEIMMRKIIICFILRIFRHLQSKVFKLQTLKISVIGKNGKNWGTKLITVESKITKTLRKNIKNNKLNK